ncbi:MAG TPA: twin-arginine translocase TatA/TatE family subunit [Chloroflexia bacterium]|nr:twin-arginine translocase TatA/TatE family subunit [Chloroflexia bacterium]
MFEGILQPTHLVLILLIVLIIFGPGKLPQLGKTLGSGIREFRESVTHGHDELAVTPPITTAATTTPDGATPVPPPAVEVRSNGAVERV